MNEEDRSDEPSRCSDVTEQHAPMRTIMFILAGIVILFVGFQTWTTVSTKGTEQQGTLLG